MVSVPKSFELPEFCFETNVRGTEHVISVAQEHGCRRVIFASSAACYGSSPNLPSSEQDSVSLESPYAESKYQGEQRIADMQTCDGVSLRFFNVFGSRQDPHSQYAAVVSAFQDALEHHRSPIIYGDGSQTRDFTAVENIVHANLLAGAHQEPLRGAVFNVGTGKSMSLFTLLHAMAGEEEIRITYKDAREGDVLHSRADIAAISNTLGYSPILTTEKALRKLLSPRQS
jgi:UDP-glucose 4-epimerase